MVATVAVVVDVAVASGGRGGVFARAWITSAMSFFARIQE
jgi:hypothetical protein